MNDMFYFYLLICLLLSSIIIFLVLILFRKKYLKKRGGKYYSLVIFTIILIFYFIFTWYTMLKIGKLRFIHDDVEFLILEYRRTYGGFPENADDLRKTSFYKSTTKWSLFPAKHKFGFNYKIVENKYHYVFYSFGLDNDDDHLKKTYPVNLKYAFFPLINGDILIYKGQQYIHYGEEDSTTYLR